MGPENTTDELVDTLILSARYGDAEDIIACLEAGVDVNGQDERGSTGMVLIYRCFMFHPRSSDKPNICAGYPAALHMASANGHLDCIKVLIEHGAVRTL